MVTSYVCSCNQPLKIKIFVKWNNTYAQKLWRNPLKGWSRPLNLRRFGAAFAKNESQKNRYTAKTKKADER